MTLLLVRGNNLPEDAYFTWILNAPADITDDQSIRFVRDDEHTCWSTLWKANTAADQPNLLNGIVGRRPISVQNSLHIERACPNPSRHLICHRPQDQIAACKPDGVHPLNP